VRDPFQRADHDSFGGPNERTSGPSPGAGRPLTSIDDSIRVTAGSPLRSLLLDLLLQRSPSRVLRVPLHWQLASSLNPLTGWPFASITSVWNVIDGEPLGKRIVVFDCKFGDGKASWRRTVIAIKTVIGNITASSFDPSLGIEQMNDWVIGFSFTAQRTSLSSRDN